MHPADFARRKARPAGKFPAVPLRGTLTIVAPNASPQDELIRRLALDRLRDLHDDGVTMDYIGRMYGVSGVRMRDVEEDLRR